MIKAWVSFSLTQFHARMAYSKFSLLVNERTIRGPHSRDFNIGLKRSTDKIRAPSLVNIVILAYDTTDEPSSHAVSRIDPLNKLWRATTKLKRKKRQRTRWLSTPQ